MAEDITQWLQAAAAGDAAAMDAVARWSYRRLERAAARQMKQDFGTGLPGVTLEPAALVNEAFMKLLRQPRGFDDRRHFIGFATKVMLNALVDYQRRRRRNKRGGDLFRVSLSGLALGAPATTTASDLVEALEELGGLDERKSEVVKLRLLWGLKADEVAEALSVSRPTVERDFRFARAWLADRLADRP